jgi:hypothetical protein
MIDFTTDTLYEAILGMVTHHSSELPCQRLNSFVTIGDKFDFDRDFMPAKKTNPYFFSRSKGKISYPVLAYSPLTPVLSKDKNGKYTKFCHRFEVGVLDQVKEHCTNCTPCEKRKEEQIFTDVQNLLRKHINELSSVNVYIAQPNDKVVIAPKKLMDAYVTAGTYTSYVLQQQETSILNTNFKLQNTQPDFRKIKIANQMLVGMFVTVTICEICSPHDVDYTVRKVSTQEECC